MDLWNQKADAYDELTRVIPNRFEAQRLHKAKNGQRNGDAICARMRDIFIHGLGLQWSDDQIKVFNAFQNSCLPLIYGPEWPEEKARVLRERGLKREVNYSLVNMARRNGKTFSVSGAAASLALAVQECKIAIFSTCKRTSQMMLQAVMDMFDRAFKVGTHVKEHDFQLLSRNSETICYQGPDGSRRTVGSFPGSVKVRFPFFWVCVCERICYLVREGCKNNVC